MTNITFKTNNTFDIYYYRTINGDCVLEDKNINVEYKIENDVLEITRTNTHNGQTIIKTDEVKIKFLDNNTLEIYENGTTNNLAIDIWKRDN